MLVFLSVLVFSLSFFPPTEAQFSRLKVKKKRMLMMKAPVSAAGTEKERKKHQIRRGLCTFSPPPPSSIPLLLGATVNLR